MTVVSRATLKHPDARMQHLALFQVERKVLRWVIEGDGKPFNGVDYLTEHDAIKGLRVEIESGPEWVGCDLTIIPVEPPPEMRAADLILDGIEEAFSVKPIAGTRDESRDAIVEIIRQETAIDKLLDSINLYLTYRVPRLRFPKRPGLDMTEGGLILGVLEAIEQAQKVDLSNLKKQMSDGINKVQVYSNMPTPPGSVQ